MKKYFSRILKNFVPPGTCNSTPPVSKALDAHIDLPKINNIHAVHTKAVAFIQRDVSVMAM